MGCNGEFLISAKELRVDLTGMRDIKLAKKGSKLFKQIYKVL